MIDSLYFHLSLDRYVRFRRIGTIVGFDFAALISNLSLDIGV